MNHTRTSNSVYETIYSHPCSASHPCEHRRPKPMSMGHSTTSNTNSSNDSAEPSPDFEIVVTDTPLVYSTTIAEVMEYATLRDDFEDGFNPREDSVRGSCSNLEYDAHDFESWMLSIVSQVRVDKNIPLMASPAAFAHLVDVVDWKRAQVRDALVERAVRRVEWQIGHSASFDDVVWLDGDVGVLEVPGDEAEGFAADLADLKEVLWWVEGQLAQCYEGYWDSD